MERGNFFGGEGGGTIGQRNVTYRKHVALWCGCSIPMAEWSDLYALCSRHCTASSTRSGRVHCPLLTFSQWMADRFLTVGVSSYSNAGFHFLTHIKLVFCLIKTRKLHTWTLETLCRFCAPKIIDIDLYLLKLFKNMTGVQFWTTVYLAFLWCESSCSSGAFVDSTASSQERKK